MKTLKEVILENKDKKVRHYVDAIMVNSDDELLLLQRAGYVKPFGGKWAFVGGSIDEKDKSPKDALIREIKEETGIELTFNEKHTMEYFGKENHMGGQNDEEVVSDTEYFIVKLETKPEIKISREHARYKWFDQESIKEKQGKCIPDVFHYIQRYYDK
jgi:8-oxo-dGTP pyrophosphatase MutT (NUDIX family)